MIDNPVVINDYSNPIECFTKDKINDNTKKIDKLKNLTRNKLVRSNVDNMLTKEFFAKSINKSSQMTLIQNYKEKLNEKNKNNTKEFSTNNHTFKDKLNSPNNFKEKYIKEEKAYEKLKIPRLNFHNLHNSNDRIIESIMQNSSVRSTDIKNSKKTKVKRQIIKSPVNLFVSEKINKTHFKAASDFAIFNS